MTKTIPEIHAFIDAQNVVQATRRLGWDFDLVKLRKYLADKYKVTKAFYFIGYNQEISDSIRPYSKLDLFYNSKKLQIGQET